MAYRTDDEDGADDEQQEGCRIVDRSHREAACKDVAEKDHRNIRREHAAGGAGDDGEEVRIASGQRERCDLGFIADLRNEERDQRGEEGSSMRLFAVILI